ncbi:MAG: GntR family transcriptional regulator [Proteobacteria bacterium]|nr:GntR family transcriptional regulator [Pseudomonadota bacterium]
MTIPPTRSRAATTATASRARRVAPVRAGDADATVGAATYRRVRADILYGRLAPGQKLPLERMRDTYGSAVGTLREVLNALAAEGFVRAEGARGFEVEPVSPADLREIGSLRLLLECDALRHSFAAGDVEWEARVVAAHHKLASIELQVTPGDRSGEEVFRRYDWEFHNALLSACGSRLLLDLHSRIYDKYLRYLVLASVFRGEPVATEHRALMQCALARDWQRAQALTTTHVQACVAQMLAGDWWARPAARAAA